MNDDSVALSSLYERALVAQRKDNLFEAMDLVNAIVTRKPDFHTGWNTRGVILNSLGHPVDAILNYDRAIELAPQVAEYYNNRGAAYYGLEEWHLAKKDYTRAIAIKPTLEQAHMNRANILMRESKPKEALRGYRDSLAINPNYVDARLGLAFSLLELGQFEEGWEEYEWRWKSDQTVERGLPLPQWKGQDAAKDTDALMLYAEQGFGDAIQFMRYASMVGLRWGGKVYLEVRHPLTRLAQSLKGIDKVITLGERVPEEVTHIVPLLSLPRILGTTVEAIPGECPYLTADSYRAGIWRERLKQLPQGLRVGVCWSGQHRSNQPIAAAIDARRSTTLASFAPLAQIPQVMWVSLQKGAEEAQVRKPPSGMTIGDWTCDFDDFFDTAAMISCLDLVITVDTSIVHLAGALGVPTWLLNRYDGCWRWMGKRTDSPWYPSLRIFHQPKDHDWGSVMKEAAVALREFTVQNIGRIAA